MITRVHAKPRRARRRCSMPQLDYGRLPKTRNSCKVFNFNPPSLSNVGRRCHAPHFNKFPPGGCDIRCPPGRILPDANHTSPEQQLGYFAKRSLQPPSEHLAGDELSRNDDIPLGLGSGHFHASKSDPVSSQGTELPGRPAEQVGDRS